jgi:hypothetical protein
MVAVHHLDDPAARIALILLRGTRMRIGELLDLEFDSCGTLPPGRPRQRTGLVRRQRHLVEQGDPACVGRDCAWTSGRGDCPFAFKVEQLG